MSEFACKKCGCFDRGTRPGRGPHAYEAFCLGCGCHVQWLSKNIGAEYTPEQLEALIHKNEWAAIKAAKNNNYTLFATTIKKRDQYLERI